MQIEAPPSPEQVRCLSLRDPAGRLFDIEDRLIRFVEPEAAPTLTALMDLPALKTFRDNGTLISAETLDPKSEALQRLREKTGESASVLTVEHERVWFASYPQEWTPLMLAEAGELTLQIAEALLEKGYGLKDATPQNVLFRGPKPVFVDWLSFEKRDPKDLLWLAYAQFIRSFLTPLLLAKKCALPLQSLFLNHRDGLDHDQAFHLIPYLQRLLPPTLGLISLPHWLGKSGKRKAGDSLYAKHQVQNPEMAKYILGRQFRALRRKLKSLTPKLSIGSRWNRYMESDFPYDDAQLAQKEAFVAEAIKLCSPQTVLDAGCNTGHFSEIAARLGAKVVGIDFDEGAVSATYRRAKLKQLDILPLVVNLARPTPAVGWLNQEQGSFLDRAQGKFDFVLMLAVAHHLLLTDGVSMSELVELMRRLTRQDLLIEFVGPEDLSFKHLTRGRNFPHATQAEFEARLGKYFHITLKEPVAGHDRTLYLLRKLA